MNQHNLRGNGLSALSLAQISMAASLGCTHSADQEVKKVGKFRAAVTLLEVTIVLLIFVSIISMALYMSAGTISQSDSVQEIQSLNNLAVAVQKTKTNQGFPASASIGTTMDTLGIVPPNITHTGGASYMNTWGGAITFTQENSGGGFAIHYTNVPVKECKLLVSGLRSGILRSVGSGTATLNLDGLTADQVATVCAAGTPSFSTINQP